MLQVEFNMSLAWKYFTAGQENSKLSMCNSGVNPRVGLLDYWGKLWTGHADQYWCHYCSLTLETPANTCPDRKHPWIECGSADRSSPSHPSHLGLAILSKPSNTMLVVDEMNRGNWLLLMENKHQQTSGFQHVGHAPPPFWEIEEHFRGEWKGMDGLVPHIVRKEND